MKSSITFADEFTPISKPPMIPHDKVTLENHSNVYHPSQLHTGHHRKPSPSPDHSSTKELVTHNDKEPVTVFMHQRRPSASPDPCQFRSVVSASPVQQDRVPVHRKPSPSGNHSNGNIIAHGSSPAPSEPVHRKPSPITAPSTNVIAHNVSPAPVEVAHKKASTTVDHSSMKSVVTQAPIDNSNRRVRTAPGGTDHIVFG